MVKRAPTKKFKVSMIEYNILELLLKYDLKFYQSNELYALIKKGYFEGATHGTDVKEYFNNCEVDCKLGGNENVECRKV